MMMLMQCLRIWGLILMNHKLRPSEEFKKSLKRLTTTEQKQT
jgi:hypothetical protein